MIGMNFSMALTPSVRREAWVAAPLTMSRNVSAPPFAGTRSRLVGSGTMHMSALMPCRSSAKVPRPPSSSPTTGARITSPRSVIPLSEMARMAAHPATSPAFMSQAPRPTMTSMPSRCSRRGVNGSPDQASRSPGGTTSVWPLMRSVWPPPVPARVAVTPTACDRATSMPGNSGSAVICSRSMSHSSTARPSARHAWARWRWMSTSAVVPPSEGIARRVSRSARRRSESRWNEGVVTRGDSRVRGCRAPNAGQMSEMSQKFRQYPPRHACCVAVESRLCPILMVTRFGGRGGTSHRPRFPRRDPAT